MVDVSPPVYLQGELDSFREAQRSDVPKLLSNRVSWSLRLFPLFHRVFWSSSRVSFGGRLPYEEKSDRPSITNISVSSTKGLLILKGTGGYKRGRPLNKYQTTQLCYLYPRADPRTPFLPTSYPFPKGSKHTLHFSSTVESVWLSSGKEGRSHVDGRLRAVEKNNTLLSFL